MVFPNTIRVSLRLASVPLMMSVVLNGIPFGVSLILASVPLRTSVLLNGIQIVMKGISKYHSGIIETGKCTIEDVRGNEWYSMVMNGISKCHSGIVDTGKCTIEDVSVVLEWYSIVMNGISGYHSGYHLDWQVYH